MKQMLSILNVKLLLVIFVTIFLVNDNVYAAKSTTFTYRSPQSENDHRNRYQFAVLKLALDKTKEEYGEYKLMPSGQMNNTRAIEVLNNHSRENFFIKLSFNTQYPNYMSYVKFPVDLGVVGYRVCFISSRAKKTLSDTLSIQTLKQLTHVQGKQWVDVVILRFNGFSVAEISNYDGKFNAVAKGRYDLFCRGINELYIENEKFQHIEGLQYDTQFAFYYPLPRFFYTHASNKSAIERVTKGLNIAYSDGSLIELWLNMYSRSLAFSKIETRVLFELENPFVEKITFDYKQYNYPIVHPASTP